MLIVTKPIKEQKSVYFSSAHHSPLVKEWQNDRFNGIATEMEKRVAGCRCEIK